jgi:hypothetical protein
MQACPCLGASALPKVNVVASNAPLLLAIACRVVKSCCSVVAAGGFRETATIPMMAALHANCRRNKEVLHFINFDFHYF